MADYEKMSDSDVQRLARQGDKDALFEMVWRIPPEYKDDPVESCAWQDYWYEKAAEAGSIDAKSRYARSLISRVMSAECRQKAMKYFQSLVDDFEAGRLTGEHMEDGAISQYWLGVMLCEGYHTIRDAEKGAKLIQAAGSFFNGFDGFGYGLMRKIGELYADGLAQPSEDPSVADLEKAIEYIDIAIKRFNPERDDPNNRGYLQLTQQYLDVQKERIANTKDLISTLGAAYADYIIASTVEYKDERRKKALEISEAAAQRLKADKAAFAQLSQKLAQEGW